MKEILKQILADSAFNNDMQVDPAVTRLVKAVNYLTTQIKIVGKNQSDKDLETSNDDYVATVLSNAKEILSSN